MKSRRRNATDDRLTISRREESEPLPTELIIEILSRLPAKAIARCRCVSKTWYSMLHRPYFTELFLTRSSTQPQLLLACQKHSELYFFSSSQPQNPNENSSLVPSDYLTKFAVDDPSIICGSVHGLLCFTHVRILKGRNEKLVPVICNPSTGQSFTLPKIKTKTKRFDFNNSFFGYDPIDRQFKVLSMTCPGYRTYGPRTISEEHQILTLGAKNLSWRTVRCRIPHYPLRSRVCIEGVLYYAAAIKLSSWITLIVSFDIRSEKFGFVKGDKDMKLLSDSVLVNYKGKLAAFLSYGLYELMFDRVTRSTTSFEMWILEDREKHVWSRHDYELPPMWRYMVDEDELHFAGVTSTNEILLSPHTLSTPFYVFYYNIDSKTVRRVKIQGMDLIENCVLHTSLGYVEDIKLMEMFKTYNLRCGNRS